MERWFLFFIAIKIILLIVCDILFISFSILNFLIKRKDFPMKTDVSSKKNESSETVEISIFSIFRQSS